MTREEARELLLDYLYGELDPERVREFERILATDEELRRELEGLRLVRAQARRLRTARLSSRAKRRIMDLARRHSPVPDKTGVARFVLSPVVAGGLAMVLVLVGAYVLFRPGPQQSKRATTGVAEVGMPVEQRAEEGAYRLESEPRSGEGPTVARRRAAQEPSPDTAQRPGRPVVVASRQKRRKRAVGAVKVEGAPRAPMVETKAKTPQKAVATRAKALRGARMAEHSASHDEAEVAQVSGAGGASRAALEEMAREAIREGRTELALRLYREAVARAERERERARLLHELGKVLVGLGRLDEAAAVLRTLQGTKGAEVFVRSLSRMIEEARQPERGKRREE